MTARKDKSNGKFFFRKENKEWTCLCTFLKVRYACQWNEPVESERREIAVCEMAWDPHGRVALVFSRDH